MAKILIFGAGKSSTYFLKCIQEYSEKNTHEIQLIDMSFDQLPVALKWHSKTTYIQQSVQEGQQLDTFIKQCAVVVSLLPPQLHITIAKLCVKHQKSLLTASYLSDEMQLLDWEVRNNKLLFLNELGVDPGLDHMSALTLISQIQKKGGVIKSFKSYTGGIVAQKSPQNLWNYRITWNPKNVIRAGHEGAVFLKNGKVHQLEYSKLFSEIETVTILGEVYDSYANRNSLKYIEKYNLQGIASCYRGTLRHQGFCEAWDVFVQLGLTKEEPVICFKEGATREDFLKFFLKLSKSQNTRHAFLKQLQLNENHLIIAKFEELGFFDSTIQLNITQGTPAEILQDILEQSWKIQPTEKDMLLMQHEVIYEQGRDTKKATRSLQVIGENQQYTAMAKTVGAPLFEALCLVLEKKINLVGVHLPTHKALYQKIYPKMDNHQLIFQDASSLLK